MSISPLSLFIVGIGGAAGSILRYVVTVLMQSHSSSGFPYGTLAVNVVGCFVIGLLIGASIHKPNAISENLRLLFATGFCGGFTTFSAFSGETLAFMDKGEFGIAAVYVTSSLALGLVGTFIGILTVR